MKSGTRNLVIVASCIVVLGGAAAALALTGGKSDTAVSSSSAPTTDLVSKKSSDIVSMSVKNKKGSYTLVPTAAKASSSVSSASDAEKTVTYSVQGLDGVPIDSSAAEQVIQNGFSLVATQNLGTVSNLAEYGLKSPQATVEVRFKDGSSYNYKIGSVSAADSTSYYMSGENSNIVYVVSVDAGILDSVNYFVKKDLLSIQSSSGQNDFTSIRLSGKNYPQPVAIEKTDAGNMLTSPMKAAANEDKVGAMENAFSTVNASSVVKAKPTAQELKTYGLDQPSAVAEFTVNKEAHKLSLGGKSESGYYAMLDEIPVVYALSGDSVSTWVQADAFSLRNKLLLLPNIATVKSITGTQGSTVLTLNVARTKDETKSTQDKPAYTYQVTNPGGKKLDYETTYKNFYSELISIELLEAANGKPAGTPSYTVEYHYFDKAGTDKIEFYKNGDRRYTAVVNGEVYGNVTSPDVDKVMYDFGQLNG